SLIRLIKAVRFRQDSVKVVGQIRQLYEFIRSGQLERRRKVKDARTFAHTCEAVLEHFKLMRVNHVFIFGHLTDPFATHKNAAIVRPAREPHFVFLPLYSPSNFPTRKKERLELEVQFENLLGQMQDLTPRSLDDLELIKTTLVNCCELYRKRKSRQRGPITMEHIDSLRMLQQNPDILLSSPDKGAGIVILNRSDYIKKVNDILADQTKFRRVANERDKTEYADHQVS
ncbi:uncharacterized protein DEA37_0008360, partial [Paragonimus westermani]